MTHWNIDGEKLVDAILKAFILGVMTFGVNYIRGIGLDTQKLNLNLVKLQYEIRSLSDNQALVNKDMMMQISSHENRINNIERKHK